MVCYAHGSFCEEFILPPNEETTLKYTQGINVVFQETESATKNVFYVPENESLYIGAGSTILIINRCEENI